MHDYLIKEATLNNLANRTRELTGETKELTPNEIIDLLQLEKGYLNDALTLLTEKGATVPQDATLQDLTVIINSLTISSVGKAPAFDYIADDGSNAAFTLYVENPDAEEGEVINWRAEFLKSGTLTFTQDPGWLDVFVVGGGGGSNGYGGGGGGYTQTTQYSPQVNENYSIVIGKGGTRYDTRGGTTSAFNASADGGYTGSGDGGAGGSGGGGGGGSGGSNDSNHPYINRWGGAGGSDGGSGTDGEWEVYGGSTDDYGGSAGKGGAGQGPTTRAFGEAGGKLYAGGGGGVAGKANHSINGSGGAGGGASGAGSNAAANTGGGGGGYYGEGGSGIVIIRNSRTVS